jgi:flavin reductase (DIM6/NTAB) family NADH-FMN oxidoreductase RutF
MSRSSGRSDQSEQGVPRRFEEFDLPGMNFRERYGLLNGSIIPRPIALVSTRNQDGTVNAAPFSSFMIASVEAGYLAFSIGPRETPKVTLLNIEREREYVINTVPEGLARQVQLCGEDDAPAGAKASLAGLGVLPSKVIQTPRIADSKVQFECRLHCILQFGESRMVVGAIALMHVQGDVIRDGKIDPLRYGVLGRIAGRSYCRVRDLISV